jgi:TonB-linked SusC/RagA family outer membrane protein
MRTQEIDIGGRSVISAALEFDTQIVDEVIVIAYGTTTRSQFAGSASVVRADEIQRVQTSNVTNALVGRVTGMQIASTSGQPGISDPTVRVRGIGSINAGSDPLIIVDGAPYSGTLENINAMDIESVTVLKDAVSNALYGARGANGVILITTRRGSAGEATIVVDAKWGVNTRASRDYNFVRNPALYYEMYYGGLVNFMVNSQGLDPARAHAEANRTMTLSGHDFGLGYNVYTVPAGQTLIGSNGRLNPAATLGNLVSHNVGTPDNPDIRQFYLTPDNWLKEAYKPSMRKEYNMSATSGTDKSSFFMSFGYLDNEGITANSNHKRITGRLRADHQVKPWMKMGGNMAYVHTNFNRLSNDGEERSSGNIFAFANRLAPIYPLYMRDGDGNIMVDGHGFQMFDYGDGRNAGSERPFLPNTNALQATILDTNSAEGNQLNATGFFEVTFLQDFKFLSSNTVTVNERRNTWVTNPFYGTYAPDNGRVTKEHLRWFDYSFQQLLTYAKGFDVHNFNVLIGHEYYRSQFFQLSGVKSNMFDPNNKELNGAILNAQPGSYTTDYMTDGYFSRLMYDYDRRYFLSLSYRRDATSRFHRDHQWGNFWSAGLAWSVVNEDFFNVPWVNMLRLKASYGEQGNDAIGDYRFVDTYDIVNSNGRPAAVPRTRGNEFISWEKYQNFNTGIDFSLLRNRLGGTIEFYNRKTSDMLFSFPLPPSFGWSSYFDNIGDMRNRGLEADLRGTPVQIGTFSWDVRVNLTTQKNKIIRLPEERKTRKLSDTYGYSSGNHYFGEGKPLFTFMYIEYAGVNEIGLPQYWKDITEGVGDDGFPIVIGRELVTNASDATDYLHGTALPDLFGGFGTTLNFRGFDFSVDFVYQIGGYVYDLDYANAMIVPEATRKGTAFHADLLNSWTPENNTSNIPRFQFNQQHTNVASSRFLTDASFLSLQNISLGYTVPRRITRMAGIESVRVYGVCDNIYLWSKRQGLDPRQTISGSTTAAYYAPIRTFSGGITLTF